jgi:hypothetical protein
MDHRYLQLAKDYLALAERRHENGGPTHVDLIVAKGQLAASIAMAESVSFAVDAATGAQDGPQDGWRIKCVHGVHMGEDCEPCIAATADDMEPWHYPESLP